MGIRAIGNSKLTFLKLNFAKLGLDQLEELRWFFDQVEELRVPSKIVFVNGESVEVVNFRI